MKKRNSLPEKVGFTKWILSISLLPLALLPGILMSAEAYSDLVGRFQFITGYPFVLALVFNTLRRPDANLFQGSLTLQASSEGISRWKLLIFTLAWDTPLMVCLALFIARDQGAQGQAILVVQALSCLYIEAIAGLLFPTMDPAIILVNFAPYFAVTTLAEPLVDLIAEAIRFSFSSNWALPILLDLAGFRVYLGFAGRGRWVVPGMSGFVLAITLSVVETQLIGFLPPVGYEQNILLKAAMTVTTCVMVLNYRYLTNREVVVIGNNPRKVHIWVLASIYSAFAGVVLALFRFWQSGFWSGLGFAQDLVTLLLACLVCLIASNALTKARERTWQAFYQRTEALIDDGISAVISKGLILILQGVLR